MKEQLKKILTPYGLGIVGFDETVNKILELFKITDKYGRLDIDKIGCTYHYADCEKHDSIDYQLCNDGLSQLISMLKQDVELETRSEKL